MKSAASKQLDAVARLRKKVDAGTATEADRRKLLALLEEAELREAEALESVAQGRFLTEIGRVQRALLNDLAREIKKAEQQAGAEAALRVLLAHLDQCPLGWHAGKLIRHRDTTETDVVAWLQRLFELKNCAAGR